MNLLLLRLSPADACNFGRRRWLLPLGTAQGRLVVLEIQAHRNFAPRLSRQAPRRSWWRGVAYLSWTNRAGRRRPVRRGALGRVTLWDDRLAPGLRGILHRARRRARRLYGFRGLRAPRHVACPRDGCPTLGLRARGRRTTAHRDGRARRVRLPTWFFAELFRQRHAAGPPSSRSGPRPARPAPTRLSVDQILVFDWGLHHVVVATVGSGFRRAAPPRSRGRCRDLQSCLTADRLAAHHVSADVLLRFPRAVRLQTGQLHGPPGR